MRTTILPAIVVSVMISLSSISLNAQEKITYSNIFENSSGKMEEMVCVYKSTQTPISKKVHRLDDRGNRIETLSYVWEKSGWELECKYEYGYAKDGILQSLTYSKWNKKAQKWEEQKEHAYHPANTFNQDLLAKK